MSQTYIQVVVLLHLAFAGVFFFLLRQGANRFAQLFAGSWTIEAIRAAILLWAGPLSAAEAGRWYGAADALSFVANWWLLSGCAALVAVRLPRWLGPAYFISGVPVVWFVRFWLAPLTATWFGREESAVQTLGIAFNLTWMFVPVAVGRGVIAWWLFRLWNRMHLPGALVAAVFCVPYAVVALAVPFQYSFEWSPDWVGLLWCARVLGISIGLVVLMLNLQQRATGESEARLSEAQEVAAIGSWELDVSAQMMTWSAELFRIMGRDARLGVMSEQEFLQAIHPRDREAVRLEYEAAHAERRPSENEFRIQRADGSTRWIQGRSTSHFNPAGELVRRMGIAQDVTKRKRSEARAGLQHEVTRVLAEGQPLDPTLVRLLEIIGLGLEAEFTALWTVSRGGEVLRCAQLWHAPDADMAEMVAISRKSEYKIGHGLPGRLLAERRAVIVLDEELAAPQMYPRRKVAVRAGLRSGCGFPIQLRTEIYGVVEIFLPSMMHEDRELRALLTALGLQLGQFVERLRLEDQYRQSQKMEAVGTLAGGIAHDFNNMLTAIGGYCELAQIELPPQSPAVPHLLAVREGARRAAALVRQIMAFSRQQLPERQPLVLSAVVGEAMRLLRATIPATIEIQTRFEPDLPAVLADPTSIHQIVVNLCTNACHAMKGRSGRLNVAVLPFLVDEAFAATHRGLHAGPHVELVVEDNGIGMDADTVARIFEPFFTTKAPGEGTGLGLAVVHGIVQGHDGGIFVYSRPGEGTRFHVYFPVHAGSSRIESKVDESLPQGNGEVVVYVEDEPQLAEMGRQMLRRLGYTAEVWSRPTDALARMQVRSADVAVLATDLTMPGMTGIELAQRVHALRPDLPIVLMSGYASTLAPEQLREAGICEFLAKPHALSAFARTIDRVRRRVG